MSTVSIITQPQYNLGSSNNDSIFVVSGSSGVAGSVYDFKYIADVYISGSFLTTLKTFPELSYGYGIYNLKSIVKNLTSFDFVGDTTAEGTNIFHTGSNSFVNITMNFGKEFSTTSGFSQSRNEVTSSTFVYLNSSIPFKQQGSINWNSYIVSGSGTGKFLNSTDQPFRTYNNLRQWLYYYHISGSATGINVTTYNSNGSFIGSYNLPNPYSGSTGVQYIGVGIPELSGQIPFTNVSSYTVNLENSLLSPISELITYNVYQDCGKFAGGSYQVFWLDTFGNFNSWLFNKMNQTTTTKTQSTYKKITGKVKSDGSYPINTYSRAVVPFFTQLQDSIQLNTDFLQDADVVFLKGLFSSPVVFIQGSDGILINATIDTSSYILNQRLNNKIYSLTLTFLPSNTDARQLL